MASKRSSFDPQRALDDVLRCASRALIWRRERRSSGPARVVLTVDGATAVSDLRSVLRLQRTRRPFVWAKEWGTEFEWLGADGHTLAVVAVSTTAAATCSPTRWADPQAAVSALQAIDDTSPLVQLTNDPFLTLAEPGRLFEWLDGHGVRQAKTDRNTYLRGRVRARRFAAAQGAIERAWWKLAPPEVRLRQRTLASWPPDRRARTQALSRTKGVLRAAQQVHPDRVLDLWRWLGSGGDAPWGCRGPHEIPEHQRTVPLALLLALDLDVLIASTLDLSDEPAIVEGAMRLFGAPEFHKAHPDGLALLPPPVRQRLLDHALSNDNPHRRFMARKAFEFLGGPVPWD